MGYENVEAWLPTIEQQEYANFSYLDKNLIYFRFLFVVSLHFKFQISTRVLSQLIFIFFPSSIKDTSDKIQ